MKEIKVKEKLFSLQVSSKENELEIAELILVSTNCWYENNGKTAPFSCTAEDMKIYRQVYESIDEGCHLLMVDYTNDKVAASCFYHLRKSHMSLGIMNVHPDYAGYGLASQLLKEIICISEREKLPLRLISSAMNLDSFSLYNKNSFKPEQVFQDMLISVPKEGFDKQLTLEGEIRKAELRDVDDIYKLEKTLLGLDRKNDIQYLIENEKRIWSSYVYINRNGQCEGFLSSVFHPATKMLGPGVMKNESIAFALILTLLNEYAGETMLVLAPSKYPELIKELYQLGAKNCEIHMTQVRGESFEQLGVSIPTFLPESA